MIKPPKSYPSKPPKGSIPLRVNGKVVGYYIKKITGVEGDNKR